MATLTTRAGEVAYFQTGAGRTVVLLHATLHDRHDFAPIVEALARRRRVVAVDWPGHGESQSADGVTGPLMADVLDDIVAALNLEDSVLIGNSVGGSAAARLAITRPELVKGLVLVNTGGFVPNTPFTAAFCRLMGSGDAPGDAAVRARVHEGANTQRREHRRTSRREGPHRRRGAHRGVAVAQLRRSRI